MELLYSTDRERRDRIGLSPTSIEERSYCRISRSDCETALSELLKLFDNILAHGTRCLLYGVIRQRVAYKVICLHPTFWSKEQVSHDNLRLPTLKGGVRRTRDKNLNKIVTMMSHQSGLLSWILEAAKNQ